MLLTSQQDERRLVLQRVNGVDDIIVGVQLESFCRFSLAPEKTDAQKTSVGAASGTGGRIPRDQLSLNWLSVRRQPQLHPGSDWAASPASVLQA